MRIAQVAPLYESVPPKLYGGTERVVSFLTEELVRQGHQVTLFASGDSITAAELVPVCPCSLRLDEKCIDSVAHHILLIERVARQVANFDVLHYHIDYLHYPFSRRLSVPQVTTLHGRLDIPDLVPLYKEFDDMPVVSISQAQRKPLPWINWQATIHHGLPLDLLPFQPHPADYVAFLGRISPEKGLTARSRLPCAAGLALKIAAKVDRADQKYFDDEIKPPARPPWRRIHRRDQRRSEGRIPGRRPRPAIPDRLARAVWHGHDRGDGLWHAGDRFPRWLGSGSDRSRGDRVFVPHYRRGGGGGATAGLVRSPSLPATV